MGNFAPSVLALLLNCFGVSLFNKSTSLDCLPYFSYVLFLLAVFLAICNSRIIPWRSRKLHYWAQFILEFTLSTFIMEFVLNEFWIPLEATLVAVIPKCIEFLDGIVQYTGADYYGGSELMELLKHPSVLIIASYTLSGFFFLCIAHITKVINLKLLQCGVGTFLQDILTRFVTFSSELLKWEQNGCSAGTYSNYKRRSSSLSNYFHSSTSNETLPNKVNHCSCFEDESDGICRCTSESSFSDNNSKDYRVR